MKFEFEVLCRWVLEPDKLRSELFKAASPDGALQQAVHRWGAKSTYELRIDADHPWVLHKQKKDWKL